MKIIFIAFLFFAKFLNMSNEVIKYEGKRLNISKNVLLLEEDKNIKDEDIVKGLLDSKFRISDRNILYLWNNSKVYYIKIDIQNLSSKNELSLYGWLGSTSLKRTGISYIYLENNKVVEEKFTQQAYKDDEDNLLNYGHLSFNINNKENKTIYIKSKSILVSPLILTEKSKIIKEERVYFFITNVFSGISFIVLVIILSFYFRLKKDYLLYYILIFVFTYLKSNLFLKFLRHFISYDTSYKLYTLSVAFYIFFLIKFVVDILKLNRNYINIKYNLDFIKYIPIFLGTVYFLNLVDLSFLLQTIKYMYLATFTLILYASFKRHKDGWLYKAFFFSWIPQWTLYIYINSADQFKLKIIFFDIRIIEYLEIFANLLSIAAILIYNEWEVLLKRKVEDQQGLMNILNGADNLMHGLITLIHAYKHDIKFSRAMYFRRKVDREHDNILYYDFSTPLTLSERAEEKKHFELAKHLSKDSFETYYICEDIQANDLYRTFLPEYKSFMALRLKFVESGDLGYILFLNKNKVEYEYNELVKDFRYKSSLLVQYFKTIDDIKDKYGSIVVEQALRNFHIEVLKDAGKDVGNTLQQLDKIRTISDRYVVANDPNVKRVLNLFYSNLENLMIDIQKDLTFDNPDKKTKHKIMFPYSLIEEMLSYLKDIARKSGSKVNVNIDSNLYDSYELYGHIKIIRSIIKHLLDYLYDKVILSGIECNINIFTSIEAGKLKINTRIEGMNIDIEELKKEYNNEVHKLLMYSTRSKLDLNVDNKTINITYYLNLLTKDEKKKFNIEYLNYDDNEDELIEETEIAKGKEV